jgi:hypothetical protein
VTSRYVTPRLASCRQVDRLSADAESLTQCDCAVTNCLQFPYFPNRFIGEFVVVSLATLRRPFWMLAHWMGIASQCSILPNHVGAVVGMCSQKQMIGAHAKRRVAVMTHAQSGRDRAVRQLIRNSVRAFIQALATKGTVAFNHAPSPQPATFRLVNFGPKTSLRNCVHSPLFYCGIEALS